MTGGGALTGSEAELVIESEERGVKLELWRSYESGREAMA